MQAGLVDLSTCATNYCLNNHNYKYLQLRKKELLISSNKRKRLHFPRSVKKLPKNFSLSIKIESVLHTRPILRRKLKLLGRWLSGNVIKSYYILLKVKKTLVVIEWLIFFVAIALNKGIVIWKQYHEKVTGERFPEFIKENFFKTFNRTLNLNGRLFLQDGDPGQVSWAAKITMKEVECQMFAIPVHLADLNPIESICYVIPKKLHQNALSNEIK